MSTSKIFGKKCSFFFRLVEILNKWKCSIFDFSKSVDFLCVEKNKNCLKCFYFLFLSYIMHNLSEWHRGTPTVPPVGAVNVPPTIRKILKIHVFDDCWMYFFPYTLYGIFIKICESKKFDRFFCIEKKYFFRKKCFFMF